METPLQMLATLTFVAGCLALSGSLIARQTFDSHYPYRGILGVSLLGLVVTSGIKPMSLISSLVARPRTLEMLALWQLIAAIALGLMFTKPLLSKKTLEPSPMTAIAGIVGIAAGVVWTIFDVMPNLVR